ncbi:MAG TPA: restriction endonuclease subunit S, partial [Candidatus Saccharibacteria bacterium]|nr:restriction endonuclease subunit S [Candidatus Saccharibacteria bacterium]
SQIERMGDGATGQTELSRSRLGEEIDIPEFSKNTQEKIGRILGAYDNLIENNSKRIEKLEAMARILYRHAIETKDVEEVKMGDVANIKWGDTSKTKKSYVPENNAFIAYSASGPDGFLPYFDYDQTGIVLSAIGANCGKTWLARGKWSCIKNTIRYFTKSDVVSNEFLYLATEGGDVWPTRGSAQPFISQGDVIASRVQILSDEGKMRELSKELSKYFELIDILSKRNHKLAQARDMLLPRLMSGEIKV